MALRPEDHRFNCIVDVEPTITMSQPDVMIYPVRSTLWSDWESTESREWEALEAMAWRDKRFEGEHAIRRAVARGINPAAQSDPVLAAVHMGSTCHSLVHRDGEQFHAEYHHLTQNGKTIFDGLKLAFGAAPELYTFLDT